MKKVIVYYSYRGNTKSIAEMIGRASRWYTLSITPETADEIVALVAPKPADAPVTRRGLSVIHVL